MSPPRCFLHCAKRAFSGLIFAITAAILLTNSAFAATISNQASLDYLNMAGVPTTLDSNVVTSIVRSASAIQLTRVVGMGPGVYQETVGPSACLQAGAFVTSGNPTLLGGTTIDPTSVQPVSPAVDYNLGEPIFIRLVDSDQNTDTAVIDYALVTVSHPSSGDSVTIQLSETGPDSGVFAGYAATANAAAIAGDCVLQGSMNSSMQVSYVDPGDATGQFAGHGDVRPVKCRIRVAYR